jgi:HEAT repeat protein
VEALAFLARDEENSVRMSALPALFSSEQPRAREFLASIARDPDPEITASFISILWTMSGIIRARGMWLSELIDPAALDDVLTRGLGHPEEAIRRLARRTLLMEKGEEFLKDTVGPADPRLAHVRQLFHLISPKSNVSAHSLDNEVPAIRLLAAARLALLKNERGISTLLDMVAHGAPSELRTMAIDVMGSIQDERVVAALLELAGDQDPEVRALALLSLGQLKAAKGEDLMIQALGDSDPKVRAGAITGIGNMESPKALKLLIQLGQKSSLLSEKHEAIKVLWKLSAKASPEKKKSPRKRAPARKA